MHVYFYFVLVTSNTLNLHSELSAISDDENSTKENSTVQVTETNQNYFNDYNYPPPFNIHCGYQYLSDPSNYVYDPQLPRPNVNDKELPCNEHEDKNEKGSFLKYKRDGAVKRKIDYENVENPVVEFKKQILNTNSICILCYYFSTGI